MLLERLGDRTEHDAQPGELLLIGGADRHRVEHRVHGHTHHPLLLQQRHPEPLERAQDLGVDLVQGRRALLLVDTLGRGVVADRLIVDVGMIDRPPPGILHLLPAPERLEAEVEHELGLVLLARDQADDVFVQPLGRLLGIDVGVEAVLVDASGQLAFGPFAGQRRGRGTGRVVGGYFHTNCPSATAPPDWRAPGWGRRADGSALRAAARCRAATRWRARIAASCGSSACNNSSRLML